MKILIIPSWYPNIQSASQGIFFSKQAGLLAGKHEVKILIGREHIRGYKYAAAHSGDLRAVGVTESEYFLVNHGNVELVQFEFNNYTFIPDHRKNERLDKAYELCFSKKVLKSWRPDVIHAHDVFNGGIAALHLKKKFGIPYVVTSHNPMNFQDWSLEKFRRFEEVIASADKIITVSDYDKRIMLNAVKSEITAVTLGNFIDESAFALRTIPGNEVKQMLFVASSSRRKDFPTLIKAMSILKQISDQKFYLTLVVTDVNDGISLQDIRNLVTHENLDEYVGFRSGVSFGELKELYAKTDLYVSPSYLETFGVTVAEAMICGIPVVAVDNGGIRDIIDPGKNGSIIPMQNPGEMAEQILNVLNGEISFDGKYLRESIVNRYGSDAYLAKLETQYNQVIQ